ncbi:type 1 glutamine amidotransferase [Nocardioides solisilvae]|uniref:type 1 glutamine amidotransferase n=1 Tax=Nocardioides solisilvae TaxID=1542435 RepID=UPI000D74A63F|nr:type 1 glutamine amidotransferase [Nocardioides solisilvae]
MAEPRILVVEHQATCPPALLGEWLAAEGSDLRTWHAWVSDEPVPVLEEHDALLVLGGEMGAYDDAVAPWLPAARRLVRDAVASGVPTLGVCLGHQLAAVALGGRVERNPAGQTAGLRPVGWTSEAADDPLLGPVAAAAPRARGIHWNNDVVTALPAGARVLAGTADGAPQVVRYADRAWGVQLHPEADEHVVAAWADGDRADHLERGIDTDAELAAIAAARAELAATWRPLAAGLVSLAREQRTGEALPRPGARPAD